MADPSPSSEWFFRIYLSLNVYLTDLLHLTPTQREVTTRQPTIQQVKFLDISIFLIKSRDIIYRMVLFLNHAEKSILL